MDNLLGMQIAQPTEEDSDNELMTGFRIFLPSTDYNSGESFLESYT